MIFTKNFILIALLNLFILIAYYMLFVICVPYSIEKFGANESISALAAGSILIGSLTGRLFSSKLLLKLGYKKIIFAGLFTYIVSIILYPFANNIYLFMIIRFFSGVGIGLIGSVAGTLIVNIVSKEFHGRAINYFSLSNVIAMALGPFTGLYLKQFTSFNNIFLLCLFLGIFGLFFGFLIKYPLYDIEEKKIKRFDVEDFIAKGAIPMAIIAMLVSICYGCIQSFLSTYTEELKLENIGSLFFLIYAFCAFISRPICGKVFDKRGENIIVYPSLILSVIGFFIFCNINSPFMLLLSGMFFGFGIANFQTSSQAICIRLVERRLFAQAISTYFIFVDLGIGVGPYFFGFLVRDYGYNELFLIAGILNLTCIPLYYFIHGRKTKTI